MTWYVISLVNVTFFSAPVLNNIIVSHRNWMEILFEQIIVEHQEDIHQHLDNIWDIKAAIDITKAIIIFIVNANKMWYHSAEGLLVF